MLKDVTLVLKCDAQLQVYYHIGHISDLKDRLYISTKTHTPNAINQPYVLILAISQSLTTHSYPPPHLHGICYQKPHGNTPSINIFKAEPINSIHTIQTNKEYGLNAYIWVSAHSTITIFYIILSAPLYVPLAMPLYVPLAMKKVKLHSTSSLTAMLTEMLEQS